MIHIVLHFIVPLMLAAAFYRDRWARAVLIMLATMLVDLDHLRADPIYDPERCSIGFHPLHTMPAILIYGLLFLVPLRWRRNGVAPTRSHMAEALHLAGLGLLVHMALDWIDCLV
jgi:hypothetical protein